MFIKILKIFLPVVVFTVLVTPSFALINSPSYEGVCQPKIVTLSGNGVGEVILDGSKVSEANGVWSSEVSVKFGDHTVKVGSESRDFNIPKCADGGGVFNQTPCLGLFGKFWDNCQASLKKGPSAEETKLIEELKNQILILQLRIQVLQLQNQLKLFLSR